MPIYEYECGKCGTFEVSQRISESPLRRCPSCKAKVTRLISQTSFQLKGSGWYVTDYSSSGKGNKKGKEEGAGAAVESKDTSAPKETADTKPAAEAKPAGKTNARAA